MEERYATRIENDSGKMRDPLFTRSFNASSATLLGSSVSGRTDHGAQRDGRTDHGVQRDGRTDGRTYGRTRGRAGGRAFGLAQAFGTNPNAE